jgi:hypothetical protein
MVKVSPSCGGPCGCLCIRRLLIGCAAAVVSERLGHATAAGVIGSSQLLNEHDHEILGSGS